MNLRVIKLLFVRLLEEVYFETERKSENIDLDPVIWQILELFLHEIRGIFRDAQLRSQKTETPDVHSERDGDGMEFIGGAVGEGCDGREDGGERAPSCCVTIPCRKRIKRHISKEIRLRNYCSIPYKVSQNSY